MRYSLHNFAKVTFVMAFVWSHSLHAEVRSASGVSGGSGKFELLLYGGFSTSIHSGTNTGTLQRNTGVSFGLGGEYRLLPKISLGMDILYVSKSFSEELNSILTRYNLNYLEFPILIKWYPKYFISFRLGPYLAGKLISSSSESQGTASTNATAFSNDYGVTFGSWLGFQTTKKLKLGIDVRYDYGLADIQNDMTPTNVINTRTLCIFLTLNITFK